MVGSSSEVDAARHILAVVGLSHHTAPLDVRERFTFEAQSGAQLLLERAVAPVREVVLLSTCNRTELYLLAEADVDVAAAAAAPLSEAAGYSPAEASGYLYCHRGHDTVRHLFRVVSSLDSMVVGEAQIQGQVRDAYEQAARVPGSHRVVGPVLARLFQSALCVGGRVRSETALGEGAASVPAAAVELARKVFGSLKGRRALVLGAGEMSALTLEALRGDGVRSLIIASRTESHAARLAERSGGTTVGMADLAGVLPAVDIIASATSSVEPVLTRDLMEAALPERRHPLFIIDMAVPRDVEPAVGGMEGVFLYDLDDVQQIVDANMERRRAEIPAVEALIDEAVEEFWGWYASLAVVPTIRALRGGAEAVRRAELAKALRGRLQDLSEEQRQGVEALTRQLLNKLLHEPTTRLREAAGNGRGVAMVQAARYLFGLAIGQAEQEGEEEGEQADGE
jgi:glutamyl-tRNA reductase